MSMHLAALKKKGDSRDTLLKKRYRPSFDDGLTKQSFADQCDINKMLKKAQQQGSISHLLKYPEQIYGEFDGEFDLLTAHEQIKKAQGIFDDLPSEIRKDFNNNALEFVKFAGNPENNDKLRDLLPAIAEPGSFFPNPVQRGGQGAGAATAPTDVAPEVAPEVPAPATDATGEDNP